MKYTSVLVLTKICHNLIFPQRVNDKFMHFLDFFFQQKNIILGIYVQTDNKENACCAFIFYLYTIHCQFLKIDISRWKDFEKNEKSLKTSWWNPRHNLKTSIRKCISIERYNKIQTTATFLMFTVGKNSVILQKDYHRIIFFYCILWRRYY